MCKKFKQVVNEYKVKEDNLCNFKALLGKKMNS